MKKIRFIFTFFVLIIASSLFAETEGEKLFKNNDPSGAIPLLEKDIATGSISADTYNFLGLSYYQIGNLPKSLEAFEKGMNSPLSNKKVLSFNQGNVAYSSGDYKKAETSFSLALAASPTFYEALLNRANARLMSQKYPEALEDYKKYITVLPEDPQEPEIRRLIAYLEGEIQRIQEEAIRFAEEQKRLEEENARMQAELARQQAEREAAEAELRAAEAERRRKLLEDVANSLQQTDTVNMTAGAEDVLDYDYESELE